MLKNSASKVPLPGANAIMASGFRGLDLCCRKFLCRRSARGEVKAPGPRSSSRKPRHQRHPQPLQQPSLLPRCQHQGVRPDPTGRGLTDLQLCGDIGQSCGAQHQRSGADLCRQGRCRGRSPADVAGRCGGGSGLRHRPGCRPDARVAYPDQRHTKRVSAFFDFILKETEALRPILMG